MSHSSKHMSSQVKLLCEFDASVEIQGKEGGLSLYAFASDGSQQRFVKVDLHGCHVQFNSNSIDTSELHVGIILGS